MNERLKVYMTLNNISRKEMSEVIGMHYNSFNRVLEDNRALNATYIEKILVYCPDLDARWLLTGVEDRGTKNKELVELLEDNGVLERLSELIANKLKK
uniref:hypothetical protein n=1 Tax=Myroides marinus TaxID=703342 RepID=UPI002578B981|nr:hypothetical protein [Myroides marinus]